MKIKYYTYASDGNTVVNHYDNVDPLCYDLSIGNKPIYKDRYSESSDILPIIAVHKGVYWKISSVRRNEIERLNTEFAKQKLKSIGEYADNLYERLLETAQNGGFIRSLEITVCRECGYDITPLMSARETYKKRQAIIDEEEKKKTQEEAERLAKKEADRIADNQKRFMNGESITTEGFIEIAKANNFKLHPRCVGALRDYFVYVAYNGKTGMTSYKSSRQGTKCRSAIAAIAECYNHISNLSAS